MGQQGHHREKVSTIHAATDPRPSISFYTPQAYRNLVVSRRLNTNLSKAQHDVMEIMDSAINKSKTED